MNSRPNYHQKKQMSPKQIKREVGSNQSSYTNFKTITKYQISNLKQFHPLLTSADVRYESEHFLPPRKKLTDSNTFSNMLDIQQRIVQIDIT
jgi:hypothetical protein